LQILAVGIGGLHYYIGLILKALHRNDATYGQRYRSGLPVNVYFGGNGCRLLNWLSLSGQFTENQISNLFKDMVVTALESTSQIKRSTAISTSPKDEAACGLVVGQMQLGNPVDEDEYLIAGEPCIIDNHQFGWDHYIFHNAIEDIQGLQVGNAENQLENLPQFLHYFNKSIKTKNITNYIPLVKNFVISNNVSDTIRDNADLWAEVDEKLRQSLLQVRGVNKQSIRLEPPFILALKALIEVLADRWANQ
jgi:hypothetical protein